MLIFCELLNYIRVVLPRLFLPESYSSASLRIVFAFIFPVQKKHGCKRKPKLLKRLEDKQKQMLQLRLDVRGRLKERLQGRHC